MWYNYLPSAAYYFQIWDKIFIIICSILVSMSTPYSSMSRWSTATANVLIRIKRLRFWLLFFVQSWILFTLSGWCYSFEQGSLSLRLENLEDDVGWSVVIWLSLTFYWLCHCLRYLTFPFLYIFSCFIRQIIVISNWLKERFK